MLPTGFSINIAFMKRLFFAIISFLPILTAAQKQVNQNEMQHIYEQVKTPYKYGLVVAPEDNNHKIDCPTVFRVGDKWMMTYVVYNGKGGTDGRGYETWIAQSDNLLEWKTLGRILSYKDEGWDCNQRGGFPALPVMEPYVKLLILDWHGVTDLLIRLLNGVLLINLSLAYMTKMLNGGSR